MRASLALLLLAATAQPVLAQTEDQLRAYFEGKTVVVLMEMPGSEEGVDIYPGRLQPIDYPRHASRLKEYGTALRRGDPVIVTKVKVKKDLIEFQLGGGGYGTFGDDASSSVSVPSAPKTEREKNLEKDLKTVTDPAQKRKISEELDELKKERQREDARNRAQLEQAKQMKEANIRQRRLEGGSRFNLRYKPVVPAEALTPEGIMRALAEYVDFSAPNANPLAPGSAPVVRNELRKGLTVDEVDALLGRPVSIALRKEGTLDVSTSIYRTTQRTIIAEFVEGVLFRFRIESQ